MTQETFLVILGLKSGQETYWTVDTFTAGSNRVTNPTVREDWESFISGLKKIKNKQAI